MNIGIIGQGRFGKLLKKLLSPHFNVTSCDTPINSTVFSAKTLFIAVPIRAFESVIKEIAPKLQKQTTVIDVCSVKEYPVEVMQRNLPQHVDIIATHPLFGPDSINSTHPKKIMLANIRNQQGHYQKWKSFFKTLGCETVEMSAEQHDRYMAESQNLTHLIGRALNKIHAQSTPLDTAGFSQLLAVEAQTCNDSLALFQDMQRYNRFCRETNTKFLKALSELSLIN